jgi:hypothetical protein
VSTGAQTLAGDKTLSGVLKVTGAFVSGGLVAGTPAWIGSYNSSTQAALWFSTPSTTSFVLRGSTAGATDLNAWGGNGVNIQQAGATVASFSSIGQLTCAELTIPNGANGIIFSGSRVFTWDGNLALQFKAATSTGATAEANKFGNSSALSTVGSKIAAFYSDAFSTFAAGFGFRGTLYCGPASIADSSGTPGNATQNAPKGKAAIANAATTCVITNDQVDSQSVANIIWESNPGQFWWVTYNAGSFTLNLAAGAAGAKTFRWFLVK